MLAHHARDAALTTRPLGAIFHGQGQPPELHSQAARVVRAEDAADAGQTEVGAWLAVSGVREQAFIQRGPLEAKTRDRGQRAGHLSWRDFRAEAPAAPARLVGPGRRVRQNQSSACKGRDPRADGVVVVTRERADEEQRCTERGARRKRLLRIEGDGDRGLCARVDLHRQGQNTRRRLRESEHRARVMRPDGDERQTAASTSGGHDAHRIRALDSGGERQHGLLPRLLASTLKRPQRRRACARCQLPTLGDEARDRQWSRANVGIGRPHEGQLRQRVTDLQAQQLLECGERPDAAPPHLDGTARQARRNARRDVQRVRDVERHVVEHFASEL